MRRKVSQPNSQLGATIRYSGHEMATSLSYRAGAATRNSPLPHAKLRASMDPLGAVLVHNQKGPQARLVHRIQWQPLLPSPPYSQD